MASLPLDVSFGILGFLLIASSFFSSAETGLISIDRYKLLSKAREGHKGARRVRRLLKRKDRLLGLILVGNNLANIGASVIATLISLQLLGDTGPVVATAVLTLYMLIFAEIAPKTLAALYPEKIAYPASMVLLPLSWLLSPLVKILNYLSNAILRPFDVKPEEESEDPQLDRKALLHIVSGNNTPLNKKYQSMLVSILSMEDTEVDDIMLPRMDMGSIDVQEDTKTLDRTIRALLKKEHHHIAVYHEEPDNIIGILDIWSIAELASKPINARAIRMKIKDPYFVPERTSLLRVLSMLKDAKQQVALVTDEYGAIQGMIDTSLILEEIVGQAQSMSSDDAGIYPQKNGGAIVDGTANIRDLNRRMQWNLPEKGDITTLNGLLLEQLQELPAPQLSVRINGYVITIKRLSEKGLVQRAFVRPMPEDSENSKAAEH
jgi:Mg2+/Co2+ transporter CorB